MSTVNSFAKIRLSGHRMMFKMKLNAAFYHLEKAVSSETGFSPFEAINRQTGSRGAEGWVNFCIPRSYGVCGVLVKPSI